MEKARNAPNSIKKGKSREAEFERNRYIMAANPDKKLQEIGT
jgi:hypothetical protein